MIGFYAAGAMGQGGGGGGTVFDVLTQQFASSTTVHSVNMPSAVSAGDMLIALVANGGNNSGSFVATPAGWTSLGTERDGAVAVRISLYYKVASGSEGGTSVNFQTTSPTQMVSTLWHASAADFTGVPEAVLGAAATSASPTPPSITPSWGAIAGTHGIVACAFSFNTVTVTSYPYPDDQHSVSAGSGTFSNIGSCTTTFGGATFTPSSFGLSGSTGHVRATIALRA